MVFRPSILLSPLLSFAAAIDTGIAQGLPFDPFGDAANFRYVLDIPGGYINDHSLIHHDSVWHLFFIRGTSMGLPDIGGSVPRPSIGAMTDGAWYRDGNEVEIGHATSRDLRAWKLQPAALRIGPAGSIDAGHVYAPSVIRGPDSAFYMVYTATDGSHFRAEHLCLAISEDLFTWRRISDSAVIRPDTSWAYHYAPGTVKGRPGPVSGRDPHLVADPEFGYLCYYVALLKGDHTIGVADGELACVAVAASRDLRTWRDLGPVLVRPSRGIDLVPFTHPESPCVVKKDDRWYLFWKGGSGTRMVVSDDPLDFHTRESHFIGTSHASKVVRWRDSWYITSCSRRVDDYAHRSSDRTRGLYMAELNWSREVPALWPLTSGVPEEPVRDPAPASVVIRRGEPLSLTLDSTLGDVGPRIRLFDAAGREVMEIDPASVRVVEGTRRVQVPTGTLQSGLYLLVADGAGHRATTRLLVR